MRRARREIWSAPGGPSRVAPLDDDRGDELLEDGAGLEGHGKIGGEVDLVDGSLVVALGDAHHRELGVRTEACSTDSSRFQRDDCATVVQPRQTLT